MSLPVNYKDDLIDATKNTSRVYDVKDSNGNVLFTKIRLIDQTEYSERGTNFGAADVNRANTEINKNSNAIADLTQNIKKIVFVDGVRPADASQHPDTLYLCTRKA